VLQTPAAPLTITLSGVSDMADKNLRNSLTAEQLRAALTYDPETGVFTWRRRADMTNSWNTRWAGKVAGYPSGGYTVIMIYNVNQRANRLAWLWTTGEWPPGGEVDHIDTDRSNNAWTNLRDSTRQQNSCNGPMRSTNTSGFKGVTRCGNRWTAYITANYRRTHIGCFGTPEEAHAAYVEAAKRLHGEFARVD
jgi:hypothetical protein